MTSRAGASLRREMQAREIVPFIGVYDVMSASLAARHFNGLFVSGFSFAASYYGLPDIGFIAWPDIIQFVQRIRAVLPEHHIMVDIDDGYCDVEVAVHVTEQLERAGASGVILEDQARPRRCGHFDGKQLLDLDQYLFKLARVLSARRDMIVVARTDASTPEEIERRVRAISGTGPDAILVDAVRSLDTYAKLREFAPQPFLFNQIAGGKSPACTLPQLAAAGVSLAIYSTPCLFAAHAAIDETMQALRARDGKLPEGGLTVQSCTAVLRENHERTIELPDSANQAVRQPNRQ
jgi:2-methylisocitrate lyase-like PEP mutase family enzyme